MALGVEMSDDSTHDTRATVRLVYDLVASLRSEVNERMDGFDEKLDVKFSMLLAAIDSLRGMVVTEPLCASRHLENENAMHAAVRASEADRQKIWDALHNIERQLVWAAGLMVASMLGLLVYLIQQHIF